MIPIRWIEIGLVDPVRLHAAYAAVAQCMVPGDPPAMLWGRAGAHLCLGQSQDPVAEVVPDPGVPVLRRPLGGGLVWVDEEQDCFALVAPRVAWPRYHQDWFPFALAPAAQTYRRFGLDAGLHGRDIWLAGRKIAGSGAATLGRAGVVAASFMRSFPARRFAACVAAPSGEFRRWLGDALPDAMTDWRSHGEPPPRGQLAAAFRDALTQWLERECRDSPLTAEEDRALVEWLPELVPEPGGASRRAVPHGIKLNEALYLYERAQPGRRALLLVRDGALARASISPRGETPELAGCRVEAHELAARLHPLLGRGDAREWASFIVETVQPPA